MDHFLQQKISHNNYARKRLTSQIEFELNNKIVSSEKGIIKGMFEQHNICMRSFIALVSVRVKVRLGYD